MLEPWEKFGRVGIAACPEVWQDRPWLPRTVPARVPAPNRSGRMRNPSSRNLLSAALAGAGLLLLPGLATGAGDPHRLLADGFRGSSLSVDRDRALGLGRADRVFAMSAPRGEFHLDLQFPPAAAEVAPSPLRLEPGRRPSLALGVLVAAGAFAGSARNSWRGGRFSNFHFTNEGFFGRDTYTGGVDKASHFVDYDVAARVITLAYETAGYSERRSELLGSGVSFLAGLVTEIGDGTTDYGFSYEDLVMDALGAATAFGLAATGWDDTIGLRAGKINNARTPACCYRISNYGRDYSGEVYTGDLKIAGLARRLHLRPGLARYLLLSMNYSTNGYRFATRDIRQRLLGLEVGINFSAIAQSLKVPQEKWWGRTIYLFFDSFRIPFSGIGFRYDLNHNKWYGPTSGRTPFDPSEAAR